MTSNQRYVCNECDRIFRSKKRLIDHIRSVCHKIGKACSICGKWFRHESDHRKHVIIHKDKAHICFDCGKKFYTLGNLNTHKMIHTGDKPHSCPECGKQFRRLGDLDQHKRTHSGEKPHLCFVCGKKFSQLGHLNRHKRTHSGEKPYSCLVCSKKFNLLNDLNVHERTHSGEKPYSCFVCDKKFRQSNHLNAHKRTHSGEKPYSCLVCDKKFSQSSSLNSHKIIHTEEKPHSCSGCSKKFARSNNLKRYEMICPKTNLSLRSRYAKKFRESSHSKPRKMTRTKERPHDVQPETGRNAETGNMSAQYYDRNLSKTKSSMKKRCQISGDRILTIELERLDLEKFMNTESEAPSNNPAVNAELEKGYSEDLSTDETPPHVQPETGRNAEMGNMSAQYHDKSSFETTPKMKDTRRILNDRIPIIKLQRLDLTKLMKTESEDTSENTVVKAELGEEDSMTMIKKEDLKEEPYSADMNVKNEVEDVDDYSLDSTIFTNQMDLEIEIEIEIEIHHYKTEIKDEN